MSARRSRVALVPRAVAVSAAAAAVGLLVSETLVLAVLAPLPRLPAIVLAVLLGAVVRGGAGALGAARALRDEHVSEGSAVASAVLGVVAGLLGLTALFAALTGGAGARDGWGTELVRIGFDVAVWAAVAWLGATLVARRRRGGPPQR